MSGITALSSLLQARDSLGSASIIKRSQTSLQNQSAILQSDMLTDGPLVVAKKKKEVSSNEQKEQNLGGNLSHALNNAQNETQKAADGSNKTDSTQSTNDADSAKKDGGAQATDSASAAAAGTAAGTASAGTRYLADGTEVTVGGTVITGQVLDVKA